MSSPAVETWIEPSELEAEGYAEYWNDESIEREKAVLDVRDGDFERMEAYLREMGLAQDLELCLGELRDRGLGLQGTGVDVAAGNLWAVPYLAGPGVERLYCVEYSRHRLLELGPLVVAHYGVPPEKVVLALGSFYELRLDTGSADFAFLSQAFHHADRPEDLLAELRRVLRPGGIVVMIGEHVVGPRELGRALARRAVGRSDELFPPDRVLGDHLYLRRDYRRMFAAAGFETQRVHRRGSAYQSFLLVRGA